MSDLARRAEARRAAATAVSSPKAERSQEIELLTESFIRHGGKITKCPIGATARGGAPWSNFDASTLTAPDLIGHARVANAATHFGEVEAYLRGSRRAPPVGSSGPLRSLTELAAADEDGMIIDGHTLMTNAADDDE